MKNKTPKIEIIVYAILIFLSMILFSLFVNSQQVIEMPSIPSIPNFGEVKYYDYKYANYSNIIISTKKEVFCEWKPDNIDDGWKTCEAVFDIENLNIIKPTITLPNLNFSFLNSSVRNIVINFSNISTIYNETYSDITEQLVNITDENGNNITAMNATERILQFVRRKFDNFTAVPNTINTATQFAIRIKYEAPKDQENQFNFNISTTGFRGFIDPDQSSCADLSTANSVYTLTQDISSVGACL